METWKTNLDETKKRYIDWWNHKGIILNMWEHFQEVNPEKPDVPINKNDAFQKVQKRRVQEKR